MAGNLFTFQQVTYNLKSWQNVQQKQSSGLAIHAGKEAAVKSSASLGNGTVPFHNSDNLKKETCNICGSS